MPELPEVEVTKRGISKSLLGQTIAEVFLSGKKMRLPLLPDLKNLVGGKVTEITRRGKYIIIRTDTHGSAIVHLGMTGHFHCVKVSEPYAKHDHFALNLTDGISVRLNDSRRFGLVVYVKPEDDPLAHPVLAKLGPEPFSDEFTAEYLHQALSRRKCSIKQALMDNQVVVGIGNIYASEVLFYCGISPLRAANTITLQECVLLRKEAADLLARSIQSGGTTIRDFEGADGKPGYFVQNLKVYGKAGQPCPRCGTLLEHKVIGQRSTYFCPHCQH